MSNEAVDRQQQEMRNFMSLLPLSIAIAGLSEVEAGRHLNEGQMDVRATQLKAAYRIAKRVIRDVAKESTQPASNPAIHKAPS